MGCLGGEHRTAAVVGAGRRAKARRRRAADENQSVQPKETKSWFSFIVQSSGFIGLVILLLSIYFVSTVGRLFFELRMPMAMPPEILGQCEERLQQRDFKGIFDMVRDDDSFFSRLLTTGISELPNGLAEAREAMERVGDAITVEMEKKISMLAVLGTLGPMIGLLGTLHGHDRQLQRHRPQRRAIESQRSGRRHFRGPGADVRGRGAFGAGDLLLRPVPQPRGAYFSHARWLRPTSSCGSFRTPREAKNPPRPMPRR